MTRTPGPILRALVLAAIPALAIGSGCAGAPETGVATQADQSDPCDPLVCPGNSDLIAALGPYELSLAPPATRPASSRGFTIESITRGGVPLSSFHVDGASLQGWAPGEGDVSDGNMVGTTLRIRHVKGKAFDLHIEAYERVPFYDLGKSPRISGYKITYRDIDDVAGAPAKDLCPYRTPDVDPDSEVTPAVFWRGDRYNPDTGAIFASGLGSEAAGHVGDWFNLSCAGEATIKMLRNEAGEAVEPEGAVVPTTTVAERQATLNMFTAKYCPDARRYTELGRPLSWDDTWTSNQLGRVWSFEAIWTQTGAACLDTPRLVKREEIKCKIPSCDRDLVARWEEHGFLKSGNPVVLVARP